MRVRYGDNARPAGGCCIVRMVTTRARRDGNARMIGGYCIVRGGITPVRRDVSAAAPPLRKGELKRYYIQ